MSKHPASFRDPSGFIFTYNHKIFRQVNESYKEHFELLIRSGLYDRLFKEGKIISHQQINENLSGEKKWYTTLLPEQLEYVSYPYEWPFDMLKDAAICTLEITKEAIRDSLLLKDASAFNMQWHKGQMRLIDSLSFETYDVNLPWVAYRQFCEHFLAPLAFMHYLEEPVHPLLSGKIEGLPLSLVRKLLPYKSKFNLHLYLHLHLHASLSGKKSNNAKKPGFSSTKMKQLLDSLESSVRSCSFSEKKSTWSDYYEEASQRDDYLKNKKEIISGWIEKMPLTTALDAGANEGEFSEILAAKGVYTISIDGDHIAVNKLYNRIKNKSITNIHPLVMDLANPSPAIGWNNEERSSFIDRTKTDIVFALALIHHLAIAKNVSLKQLAALFSKLGKKLIIEFVPKEDEKVQLILKERKDIFEDYSEKNFIQEFSLHYTIIDRKPIAASKRTLFLLESI